MTFPLITNEQVRSARALLGWRLEHLATASGVPVAVVRNMEAAHGPVAAQQLAIDKIVAAFARRGVEFRVGDAPSVKRVSGIVRRP
jgi:hypothetical protein